MKFKFKMNSKNKIKKSLLVAVVVTASGLGLCSVAFDYDLNHYDYVSPIDQSKRLSAGSESMITFNESKTESIVKSEVLNSEFAKRNFQTLPAVPALEKSHFVKIDINNSSSLNKISNLNSENFVLKTKNNELLKPILTQTSEDFCTIFCRNSQTLIFNIPDNIEIKSLGYFYNNRLKELKFDYSYQKISKNDFNSFVENKKTKIDFIRSLWLGSGILWGVMTYFYLKRKEKTDKKDDDLELKNDFFL